MGQRVVVVGGAGVIGSHLCLRLLKEGSEVICIDRRNQGDSALLRDVVDSSFNYIKHDITIPYRVSCDELYNLASPRAQWDQIDPIDQLRLDSLGVVNTLDTIHDRNKTRVVYASADDVYNFRAPENLYFSPNRFIANAKRAGESIHEAYYLSRMIESRVARIFTTYGSDGDLNDQRVVTRMIVEALNNRDIYIYGSGEQSRTFCWVEDIVDGLIKLMRAHAPNGRLTLDLGSSTEITIRELADMIVSLCGSRSNIYHLGARLDEPRFKYPNLKHARNELKWEATTPLKEGLLRLISFLERELSRASVDRMSWVEIHV